MYCSVPQIRPPPFFATLALVQSAEGRGEGGAYMRDVGYMQVSLANMPSFLVSHPQLRVQIEDNAFDDFAVAIWKGVIYAIIIVVSKFR